MAKKRANGEGNIRKRADGRWEGRYTAGYLIIETVLLVNPEVIGFPFAGVEFQRLIGKLGNVFDVEGAALSLQALHVFFVHGLEAPESF